MPIYRVPNNRLLLQQQTRTFAEEHVPNPENGRPRQISRVNAHEPFGHVKHWLNALTFLQKMHIFSKAANRIRMENVPEDCAHQVKIV